MKKTKVEIKSESTEQFFDRLRSHARAMDRGGKLPTGITISFEDPLEMLSVLTVERLRLLKQIKQETQQISVLARSLKREVRAVSRDVLLLEKAGLVKTSYANNPGHGRMKLVEPVAQEYKLVANL
ncbi:hypothetical protein ACOBR2_00735 [Telmatobacter bradus]|uniref:HVO_A0114 family putative DNA-binding protein n=1 Tax=Telmatobacter bradus TaxID=474953 RepID=UPI003B432FAC